MKKRKKCPVCAGGKMVSTAGQDGSERPCVYCDQTGDAPLKPLYSKSLKEEMRIWDIREEPGSRVRQIARARVGNPYLPLHPTELLWLREGMRDNMIPLLARDEWDALVRLLLDSTDEERVKRVRAGWEAVNAGAEE